MMRARLRLVLGVTLMLTLRSSTVHAQLETFVLAVRELADATAQPEPLRSNAIRTAANRMRSALVEWDRHISALEARVDRESAGARDQRAYQGHVELGVAYRTRGRLADALREFDAAIALQPSASDLQVLRALTLEAAGRLEEAGKAFRAAWTLDARDPVKAYYVAQRRGAPAAERERARAALTNIYRRLEFDAAPAATAPFVILGAIPDNLSRTPVVADGGTSEGFALLGANKYSDAVAVLTERSGIAPRGKPEDAPLAHFSRGQHAEAENRVADARHEYQAALAGAIAGRSVLLVGLARLAQVDGDPAGAIDALTQAARLNPNDPNIHKELASAYAAEGRGDDAFCELMAALLIDRRDAQAHASIGQLFANGGRDAEAVAAYNRALDLAPARYEIRYALAAAHRRLGNAAEAARQLDIFERARRQALERRRRDIANEVQQEEAARTGVPDRGPGR
jgi:tetratricopeptide (TPR) repeat protein